MKILKELMRRKVFAKNFRFILLIMVCLLSVILIVMVIVGNSMVHREIENSELKQMQKISTSVEEYFYSLVLSAANFASSNVMIADDEFDENYMSANAKTILSNMEFYCNTNRFVRSITLEFGNRLLFYGNKSEYNSDDLVTITVFNDITIYYVKNDKWPHRIYIIYENDKLINKRVVIECYASQMSEYIIGEEIQSEQRAIVSRNGTVILSCNADIIGKNIKQICGMNIDRIGDGAESIKYEGKKYFLIKSEIDGYNLKTVSLIDFNVYKYLYRNQNKSYAVIMVSFIISFIIMTYLIVAKTYSPINSILTTVKHHLLLDDNNLDDEILYINKNIADTFNDNDNLQRELDITIESLHRNQLLALQSQINSHFVCNTIEALKWLSISKLGFDNAVENGLADLGSIISETIDTKNIMTTLGEECKLLLKYINILRIRYGDRFNIEWDFQSGIENAKVLEMIIQPMLENAVFHGFYDIKSGGIIKISIKRKEKNLEICVSDNGRGIEPEILSELQRSLRENNISMSKHIGLRNINLRIKLLYGEKYGLKIDCNNGVGTRCVLTFPYSEDI